MALVATSVVTPFGGGWWGVRIVKARSVLVREPHRLAADRVVLAERVTLPVLVHQDADEIGVALDPDAHHVEGLSLVPVGGRPDRDHARYRLPVVAPDL